MFHPKQSKLLNSINYEQLILCMLLVHIFEFAAPLCLDYMERDIQMRYCTINADQVKVLNAQTQIFTITFVLVNLLSVDSFQKLNFCI